MMQAEKCMGKHNFERNASLISLFLFQLFPSGAVAIMGQATRDTLLSFEG
jgi:hypothetical protein